MLHKITSILLFVSVISLTACTTGVNRTTTGRSEIRQAPDEATLYQQEKYHSTQPMERSNATGTGTTEAGTNATSIRSDIGPIQLAECLYREAAQEVLQNLVKMRLDQQAMERVKLLDQLRMA